MPIDKEKILQRINNVQTITLDLLKKMPDDNDLIDLKNGLDRIEANVREEWPLSSSDRKKIDIGMYAMRELEGGPYGELPRMLLSLNTYLTFTEEELIDRGINPDNI